ncbi:nucleotidyltransferase family protein [bacterium]|nr:nucleotidyltransferase family protein [bacterium]
MTIRNLQPEQQLCLILARMSLSPELAALANFLIRNGLDWDTILDFSSKHRVFPLVFRHLERFEPGLVPPATMRLFGALCAANTDKSDMFADELARIVKRLGKAGIPAVSFKGPLLAHVIWGDHRLWVGQDLDILVQPTDQRRAEKVLWADGYQTLIGAEEQRTPHSLLPNRGAPVVTLAKHNARIPITVELHTTLFPWWMARRRLDEQVWQAAHPGNIFGASGLLLSPSWNFILLSLHAYKHLFVFLRWVCELHELWRMASAEQVMILRKSEQIGLDREVSLSIAVSERLLGKVSDVSSSVNNVMLTRPSGNMFGPPPSRLSQELLLWKLPGRAICKMRRLLAAVFAPTGIERRHLSLPRWLHFLHYLIRPVRLVLKYGLRQPLAPKQEL